MPRLFAGIDRHLAAGLLVVLASATMLAVGLLSIFAALGGDGADLPSEGSIQEIIDDSSGSGDAASGQGDAVAPVVPPVRFSIPRLYIDAPVLVMGRDESGSPMVPDRPDQVAWYDFSAGPGRSSNAVFSGHVDWQTRTGDPIPGVFYRLRELEIGDPISIVLADGSQLEYRVTGNVATAYDDPNVAKAMDSASKDVVTLITCGGTWIKDSSKEFGGVYSHRVIVRAERAIGLAGNGPGAAGG